MQPNNVSIDIDHNIRCADRAINTRAHLQLPVLAVVSASNPFGADVISLLMVDDSVADSAVAFVFVYTMQGFLFAPFSNTN
jgi:hypothetical protein